MNHQHPFKWRHYSAEIILLCVRWYLRYNLSYRNLKEMMNERGLSIDHTTIYRWVQKYGPEIRKKIKSFVGKPNDSWRVDETYLKVKGKWIYLYRAIDSKGKTIDFYLSEKRDVVAALTFFCQISSFGKPRVINVDKYASYPPAFNTMKKSKGFPKKTKLRQIKYLHNVLEQDYRPIKRQHRCAMGYKSLETARNTIAGIEAMHMIFKGQIDEISDANARGVKIFIEDLFEVRGLAA